MFLCPQTRRIGYLIPVALQVAMWVISFLNKGELGRGLREGRPSSCFSATRSMPNIFGECSRHSSGQSHLNGLVMSLLVSHLSDFLQPFFIHLDGGFLIR